MGRHSLLIAGSILLGSLSWDAFAAEYMCPAITEPARVRPFSWAALDHENNGFCKFTCHYIDDDGSILTATVLFEMNKLAQCKFLSMNFGDRYCESVDADPAECVVRSYEKPSR